MSSAWQIGRVTVAPLPPLLPPSGVRRRRPPGQRPTVRCGAGSRRKRAAPALLRRCCVASPGRHARRVPSTSSDSLGTRAAGRWQVQWHLPPDQSVPAAPGMWRYLRSPSLATAFVIVLPAVVVARSFRRISRRITRSVGAAGDPALAGRGERRVGAVDPAAQSRCLVFADLMLWGWLDDCKPSDAWRGRRGVRPRVGSARSAPRRSADAARRAARGPGLLRPWSFAEVARHEERIAREMQLAPADVAKVRTAAALHDVGKIHTPRDILNSRAGSPTRSSRWYGDTRRRRRHAGRDRGTGDHGDRPPSPRAPRRRRLSRRTDRAGNSSRRAHRRGRGHVRCHHLEPSIPQAAKHKQALDVLSREAGSQLDAAAVAAFLAYTAVVARSPGRR